MRSAAPPSDFLTDLAAWALRSAPDTCGDAGCAPYHRIRQTLRLLGLALSLETDGAFIAAAIQQAARRRPAPRFLIAGAADNGVLTVVAGALPGPGSAAITLIERCETPLALNCRYAERVGIALVAVRAEVAEFDAPAFDLVCAHSLFGQLSPEQRSAAARAWFRQLRPGGTVVTASRIRPGHGGTAFSAAEAAHFARRVSAAAASRPLPAGVPLDELLKAVADYTAQYASHPVRSRGELEAPFAEAGFRTERAEATAPGEGGDAPHGPHGSDGGRLRLIAARPGA